MITHPLNLSAQLRPPPRSFDYLYWVNAALIALFFVFFGSRFVLSPGIGIGRSDQLLPVVSDSVSSAVPTQLRLEVTEGGKFYIDTGFVSFDGLQQWLAAQAKRTPGATLLVLMHPANSVELLNRITDAANSVGLKVQQGALDRTTTASAATENQGR